MGRCNCRPWGDVTVAQQTQHDAPRRYVWVFTGEESGGAARVGGNARARHTDRWAIEVHCWGEDFEGAYRLRQALVTRLRTGVVGANYELGRTAIFSDDEHTTMGAVFVVALTLVTPLAEAAVLAEPDAAARIQDHVRRMGRATSIALDPGAVRAKGTAPPHVSASGRTKDPLRVRIEIESHGALGVATYRYSIDGGASWEATGVRTASASPLGGTGITLHFGAGDYQADNIYLLSNLPPLRGDGELGALEE